MFFTKRCPLFCYLFDRNEHLISIEPSFTNKATTFLRFLPPVISVRFAPNHHFTNKAKHFFASFSPVSAFDFHRNIILRTKQHISLVSPVHNQRSIFIEPSFYEQNNTFLCFLLSVISVRRSPNHHFTDTVIHFFTSFRPQTASDFH